MSEAKKDTSKKKTKAESKIEENNQTDAIQDKPEVKNEQVEVIHEENKAIIVRAKKGLSYGQYELLSKMLKSEEKNTGYKIVLMPYSIDSVEVK